MKSQAGSCHCGQVRYQVNIDLQAGPVISCNCSICQRKGTLLAFVPPEQFRQTTPSKNLTDYQFGSKSIHHLFCKTCGVTAFARGKGPDGKEMVAVNIRCLEGLDLGHIKTTAFDGRAL